MSGAGKIGVYPEEAEEDDLDVPLFRFFFVLECRWRI